MKRYTGHSNPVRNYAKNVVLVPPTKKHTTFLNSMVNTTRKAFADAGINELIQSRQG